jgi:hypothetical protein
MGAYIHEWNAFNGRMLTHFNARQAANLTGLAPARIEMCEHAAIKCVPFVNVCPHCRDIPIPFVPWEDATDDIRPRALELPNPPKRPWAPKPVPLSPTSKQLVLIQPGARPVKFAAWRALKCVSMRPLNAFHS